MREKTATAIFSRMSFFYNNFIPTLYWCTLVEDVRTAVAQNQDFLTPLSELLAKMALRDTAETEKVAA